LAVLSQQQLFLSAFVFAISLSFAIFRRAARPLLNIEPVKRLTGSKLAGQSYQNVTA
jgi:hypothetical protein